MTALQLTHPGMEQISAFEAAHASPGSMPHEAVEYFKHFSTHTAEVAYLGWRHANRSSIERLPAHDGTYKSHLERAFGAEPQIREQLHAVSEFCAHISEVALGTFKLGTNMRAVSVVSVSRKTPAPAHWVYPAAVSWVDKPPFKAVLATTSKSMRLELTEPADLKRMDRATLAEAMTCTEFRMHHFSVVHEPVLWVMAVNMEQLHARVLSALKGTEAAA